MTLPTASQTAAWDKLRTELPGLEIITDPLALVTYEVDAGVDRGRPDAVAFPRNTDDVVRLVRWAHDRGIPIVARGAGTGLSGGAVAEHGGLVLCFARMKRILELDPSQRMALVEPGVVNLVLNNAARAQGLVFPPDPSSGLSATLGGNIAENAGGPHCAKYGVTTNYVAALQVVMADGQVVRFGGPAADYPEYDFMGVMTGNEGTLGIITEARLRLIRDTTNFKTLLAAFTTMEAACEAVSAIIAAGLVPAALEIVDHVLLNIIEAYAHAGLPVEAAACLVAEVDGYADGLDSQMDEIVALLKAHGGYNLVVAQTAEQRAQIWKARKSVGGAVARIAPAYISLDATVPRSRLAQALAQMNAICADAGVRVGYVAHAGDGNFHPHLFIDDPSDQALLRHIHDTGYHMMAACVAMGGSITGEHGVGIEKRDYLGLMFGPAEMAAMQDVKAVCDPDGLLNPGKIFPEVAPPAPQDSEPGRPIAGHCAPISTAEAAEAMRTWAAAAPPGGVRICGGGTKSLPVPVNATVLSTAQLSSIIEYAPEDLYVRVGAGMPLAQLQAKLGRDGMWAPLVSPWPGATVGGMLAANFNAPLRMRYGYGSIRDQVLEATVVLPDGQAVRAGRPLVKNVAGYDLAKLFIGSYGTLGLIADVTLKLAPLPRRGRR